MIGRVALVGAIAATLLVSPSVHADPAGDVARADSLFRSGRQIRDAGWYADACPLFEESSRLAPGIGVLLYLGDCDEHLGRTASAWAAYQKAETLARAREDKRADIAHARGEALSSRLSGLTIVAPAQSKEQRAQAAVSLDGLPVPPASLNVAMAIDPGDHTVTVTMPGRAPRVFAAHVTPGDRKAQVAIADAVVVAPKPPSPPPVAPAPASPSPVAAPAAASPPVAAASLPARSSVPASPPPEPSKAAVDPLLTRRWIGIGLLAGGALGVAIGSAVFLNRPQAPPGTCDCSGPDDSAANIGSGIAFVAGGAALLAGLALTVTLPSSKPGVGWTASPVFTADGAGAVVRGRF